LVDTPLSKIKELAGKDIEVEYAVAMGADAPGIYNLGSALQAAENSDQVIIIASNFKDVEREGYDRRDIRLSPDMERAILQISQRNPNTVVVVQAGSAIDMSPWIDKVKGVIFAWYTGQAGGSAIAEIIFGIQNPSGKIAETFPMSLEDTPAYETYPGNGFSSWYKESIMVGYRYYDTFEKQVLFPFGHGLSYTQFEYSDLKITPEAVSENDEITVSLKVKNAGEMQGKEVVQLYVNDVCSLALRPYKELKGFTKVDIKPGEQKVIQFKLNRDAFAYYSTAVNSWHVESGDFRILVGSSSKDIRLEGKVNIKAD
jgi:beta-glucosidase